MKSRSAEAAHLESSYLNRVKDSLQSQSPSEVEEIIESLQEHIEEELAEVSNEPVGLVDMANVLEQLGPPETYSQEFEASPPSAAPASPETTEAEPSAGQQATIPPAFPDKGNFVDLLDKIWVGYLIFVIGLYVPIIEFQVCSLIAFSILALVLIRNEIDPELKPAGKALGINAIILLVTPIITLIGLAAPPVMLLAFPFLCGQIVCELFAYWRIMRRTGSYLEAAGRSREAERVLSARIGYTVYFFITCAAAIIVGAAIGIEGGRVTEYWFVGLIFLPFHWFFGWLFILRPLTMARRALRDAS